MPTLSPLRPTYEMVRRKMDQHVQVGEPVPAECALLMIDLTAELLSQVERHE